ncbi:hypothetical protein [Phascolarctobacterium faecium]|jgi:hypothetical protein|uniref:hypothetical protein n=1 Tax=Phascolarctobacterium faecium TaxID=33025 RepID=UPI003A8F2D6F
MNKKDEALAKFVEVVKNLSSKEFEEKYVKEDDTTMEDMKSCDITKEQKEIKAVAGDILKLLNGKNIKDIEMILFEVHEHCYANYTFTYKSR